MNGRMMTMVMVVVLAMLAATWTVAIRQHVEPERLSLQSTHQRININTAPVAELMLLPGIGPTTAQRVVDHRQAHGPFTTVDDLQAVHRIGAITVNRLRPYVTTGDR